MTTVVATNIEVPELTWVRATMKFRDPDGALMVPDDVRWKLTNITESTEVQAWTALTAASEIVLEISAQLLTIHNNANAEEIYQFLVQGNQAGVFAVPQEGHITVQNVANL